MIGNHGRADAIVIGQLARVPCVFTGNQINRRQRLQGPDGDIAKIADWRCHDMQPWIRFGRAKLLASDDKRSVSGCCCVLI
jgi:hypothetical protein